MGLSIDVHHYFHGSVDEAKLNLILKELNIMANDFTKANEVLDALSVKADKVDKDLADLAQQVIDLKNTPPADVQPAIDALVVKAQAILDKETAADDAAVPPVVTPPAP